MFKFNNFSLKQSLQIVLYTIVAIIVLVKGGHYMPDSYAFLEMRFNRSPFYCSFLKIFTSIFVANYELPVIIVQYSFIVFAIQNLISNLFKVFSFNLFSIIALQGILLAPCVYWHFTGGSVLSESIAYPLVLLVFWYTFKAFKDLDVKPIFCSLAWLFILILTRGQFISFVPIILAVCVYIIYQKKNIKSSYVILLLIIALPFLTNITEKVYNKVVFGYYVSNSMSNVHLITSGFYISNDSDIDLFKIEDEQAYFKIINQSLKEANMMRNLVVANGFDDFEFYKQNFSKICNHRIHELGLAYFEQKGLNYYEQNIALNDLCKNMVVPLIKSNFLNWIKLLFKNLKTTFGTTKQILLFLVLFFYSLYMVWKQADDIYKFIALVCAFMLVNNVLIALVVYANKRYVFYFDWVIFAIVILLLNRIYIKTVK
ncbi:MAG: hypothetical protein ACI83H_000615 [Glaciecola sp.]|jgi:hypothetical protein